jgi:transcriptional regulator with XRE-family HTH domain
MTVPRTWISKIETGKNFPKLASLELLALGLRVSIFDFVSLAMAPPSEFDRILEGILWQEELLRYFCRANRADRAFFCDFAGSLIDPARAVARERAAAK